MGESKSSWTEVDRGVTRATGERHTLRFDQAIAHVITLAGGVFEATSAVLLPDGQRPRRLQDGVVSGLSLVAQALQLAIDHSDYKLIVAGHSQPLGNMHAELSLSRRRARNVLAFLRGDRSAWIAACACNGDVDRQRISRWAARAYRTELDARQFNNDDWGTVFDLYDRHVALLLGVDNLQQARAALTFDTGDHVGCGAFWPRAGGCRRIDPTQRAPIPEHVTVSHDTRVDLLFIEPGPALAPQPEDQAPGVRLYMSARHLARKPLAPNPSPASACVRMSGMHFETNKCFMLPTALPGMRRIVTEYAHTPEGQLLVVGHTDTSGTQGSNDALALERAQAIIAYLTDDVDTWLAHYESDKPAKQRWGHGEDLAMLGELPGAAAWLSQREPIKAYQRARGLNADGICGPETRRALIRDYMDLDGTSLPSTIVAVAHGCGENFPRVATADGISEAANRRVELFLFGGEITPAPAGETSGAGSTEYPRWLASTVDEIDFEHEGALTVRVVWPYGEQPLSNRRYRLRGGQDVIEGLISDDGMIQVPRHLTEGDDAPVLEVQPYQGFDQWYRWELAVGTLDAAGTTRGAQARLYNQGFDPGALDGTENATLACAVRAFQQRHGLLGDGQLSDETRSTLIRMYGC